MLSPHKSVCDEFMQLNSSKLVFLGLACFGSFLVGSLFVAEHPAHLKSATNLAVPLGLAEPSPLAQFLAAAGVSRGSIVFMSLADGSYITEAIETAAAIPAHTYLLILCLDARCVDSLRSEPSILCYDGYVGHSVGSAKLFGTTALLEAGYHTITMDLDVFIIRDPFPYMLPLNDSSWDLQVGLLRLVARPCRWLMSVAADCALTVAWPAPLVCHSAAAAGSPTA